MLASHEQVVAAFTEWDRRYRENPEQFENSVQHLLRSTPNTYGARAAVYFTEVMKDVRRKTKGKRGLQPTTGKVQKPRGLNGKA